MKRRNIITKLFLSAFLLTLVLSCKDKKAEVLPDFEVVETVYNASCKASEGFIQMSDEGFKASTQDKWLKLEVEGKKIKLFLSENTSSYTRNTVVLITKGALVEKVPVSQFGVKNDIKDFRSVSTDHLANEFRFVMNLANKAKIQIISDKGEPIDWLTYELGDELVLKCQALPSDLSTRFAYVIVEAGLMKKAIKFVQTYSPNFKDILGTYTLDYFTSYENDETKQRKQVEVKIEELPLLKGGKGLYLTGLAAEVPLKWDDVNKQIVIEPSILGGPIGANIAYLIVGAWGAYKPMPDGSFNRKTEFNDKEQYKFIGLWDTVSSASNLKFVFGSAGPKGKELDALALFLINTKPKKHWGGFYYGKTGDKVATIVDFSITKKL